MRPLVDRAQVIEYVFNDTSKGLVDTSVAVGSRADQLEMLSQEHRVLSKQHFLEKSSVGLPGGSGLAGQTVGAYTLLGRIG